MKYQLSIITILLKTGSLHHATPRILLGLVAMVYETLLTTITSKISRLFLLKSIIPLVFVGCEMIIANSVLIHASLATHHLISNIMHACGILLK